jgi:hypothetical protein
MRIRTPHSERSDAPQQSRADATQHPKQACKIADQTTHSHKDHQLTQSVTPSAQLLDRTKHER